MKVVTVNMHEEPKLVDIENNLETLQSAVGGYIEGIELRFGDKVYYGFLNEEGKLIGLPINRFFIVDNKMVDTLNGNLLIVNYEENGDLTEEDLNNIKQYVSDEAIILK